MLARTLLPALLIGALIGVDLQAQVLSRPAFDPALSTMPIPPEPLNSAVVDNGVTSVVYGSFYTPPGSAVIAGGPQSLGYIAPYSYFAAPEGFPPRTYVGLGSQDLFPFHGQPYGYPYDRWTWSAMTGSPPQSLVRYYYPPVP